MKLLAVVPARGGSRRIPRKNVRLLNGKPLVLHALENAQLVAERVVCSTDDREIAAIARLNGFEVVDRPEGLARDSVGVLPVAQHAAKEVGWEGVTLVLQPTCPLITPESIRSACGLFTGGTLKAMGYVEGRYEPVGAGFYLTDNYEYAGMKQELIVPDGEMLDIDNWWELEQARWKMSGTQVMFRVTGNQTVGTGHVHRCLRIASELSHFAVWFSLRDCDDWVQEMVNDAGYANFDDSLGSFFTPDVLVNDCLDTEIKDVLPNISKGKKVVCLEDFGPGSKYADLVIQELYEDGRPNAVSGVKWAVLRPEFTCAPIRDPLLHLPSFGNVLVSFGGTDPARLTERLITDLPYENVRIIAPRRELGRLYTPSGTAKVVRDPSMAEELAWADVVITGGGRTVHEAAAMGVPVISIAANAREATHVHVPGVIKMGLHVTVSAEDVSDVVQRLVEDLGMREEISRKLRGSVDGLGARRIARKIEDLVEGL